MKRKKGLSLWETLAIIVIIGILASVGVVSYNKLFPSNQLASGKIQAQIVKDSVANYLASNQNILPTVKKNADFIDKPALIDITKIDENMKGNIKGNYYIYGPAKEISFDYSEKYIQKVYNEYPQDKKSEILVGHFINTDVLLQKGFIEYPAITKYMLETDGNILQILDDGTKITAAFGDKKPTKPVIIPSKSAPYYSDEDVTFTADSHYSKGPVTYEWTGINSSNRYPVGIHQITVVAIGQDGVRSEVSDEFVMDVKNPSERNVAPNAPIIKASPEKVKYSSDETIDFIVTNSSASLSYVWIGTNSSKKYSRGQHNVYAYAVDSKGNISPKSNIVTIDVTNGAPVINGVTYKPNPAYVFDKLTFNVDVVDNDGDMVTLNYTPAKSTSNTADTKGYSIETGRFPIGRYQSTVEAIDSLGAKSAPYTFNFEVTNRNPTKPTLTMSPSSTSDLRSYTKITFTVCCSTDPDEEAKNLTYEWDNKLDYYIVGTHTVKVRALDSNGGKSDWASITFTINNTPPTAPTFINMVYTGNLYADADITWTTGGSTDKDGQAPSTDGDYVVYDWFNKQTRYVKGTHIIKSRALDKHGAYSDYFSKTFTVINKPPTTPVISMNPGPTTDLRANTNITWGATSTDVDVVDVLSYEWINKATTYKKGTHTIQVRANDGDGGLSAYQSLTFTINNTRPTMPNISMTPGASTTIKAATSLTFSANGSTDIDVDDTLTYQWSRDGAAWTTTKPDGTYARGTHTVRVRTVDPSGGISDENSISFTVVNTDPTQPTISMSPNTGLYANTYITWASSGSWDIDGDTLTYEWVNKLSYYPKGTHTVKVRTNDGQGGYSPYAELSFYVNNTAPGPVSSISTNLPGGYDYYVSFNRGTATDLNGDPLTYEWSVDGGAWTTTVPNQNYSRGGHTVSVRAKDNENAVSSPISVNFTWQAPYQRYEVVGTRYVDTTYRQQYVDPTYKSVWVDTTYKQILVPTTYKTIQWCEGPNASGNGWSSHSPPCQRGENSTTKEVFDVLAHYETVVDVAGHYDTVINVPGHYITVVDVAGHYVDTWGYVDYPPYWYNY